MLNRALGCFGTKPQAPHPIPAGRENAVCPIAGVSAQEYTREEAKLAMESDPDMIQENTRPPEQHVKPVSPRAPVGKRSDDLNFVRLNVVSGSHRANPQTQRLVRELGGVPVLKAFTDRFYEKAFVDVHNDKFIASHEDPHGLRFAAWIAEKMGDGTPWTEDRQTRERGAVYDRQSAHRAAWNSPKREPHKQGDNFKLDDTRVWMRLHFWAAREAGFFEQHPEFMDYYVRLIGHFVSVYSSKSPPFTRDSARWSADPANIQRYLDSGPNFLMADVVGKPLEVAIRDLPQDERLYTGSKHPDASWPYEKPSVAAWMKCFS